ncbi:MFS transporter [Bacillus piscicola]|uniref:MFS transporter n=1 Tax=Bacillus piscicola TaxID=1632684 RepID=UPI001F090091|nr:MFS transporter [Bacillus piscicola]
MANAATQTQADYEQVKVKYGLMTVVFFFSGLFVVSALFATIPLNPVFTAEFHLSAEQAALTTSVYSFSYALGTIVFAPLSDRLGRKRVIIFGLLLLTVISPIIGLLSNYGAIVAFRGIQGFVAASFAPTALTFITELYPPKKRAVAVGFISAAFLMAGIVGQVYSSVMESMLSWNYVFYLFGVLYALLAAAFWQAVPSDAQARRELRSIFGTISIVLTKSFFLSCYFITILVLLSFVGVYSTLESYLQETYAMSPSEILIVRSAGIIGMLIAPFGGRLAGRFGPFVMMRSGLFLAALGLVLIGFASNMSMIIGMSILFTAGISVTVPSVISVIGQYGGEEKATAMSLYSFFLFVGSTIGPMISIYLMRTGGYTWTFEGIAILLALGFFITFILSKKAAQTAGTVKE